MQARGRGLLFQFLFASISKSGYYALPATIVSSGPL